ncbi:hypothetical protein EO087_06065 [Dyella sp. M7H15-1]|uniref:hypothetical protein n=1 Tax=Dyella sp. M7H15-1 TaxID=2501295 RepID=UPI00100523C6|nr:hypothetical protein [Dyella sp. M7H15-1]QAU23601.1 hypothetical protein EO087_06065 [Dyella sp. M7H15-1]
MHALSGERLLQAWEQAEHQHGLQRALSMLAIALPEVEPVKLAELPIAERNRLLLQLRLISFGPTVQGYASCSHCDSAMEFSLPVEHLLSCMEAPVTSIAWEELDQRFQLRAANTLDLLATVDIADVAAAEQVLLTRCLLTHEGQDGPSTAIALEKFEQLHAASELRCALACPQCAQEAFCELDIASFLWLEVRNAALRLFSDIHTLARQYGWSESAIASMSAQRRETYLELTNA